MSTPTKTPRNTRKPAAVPPTLTPDESTWLHCYRTMDLRRRNELLMHAANQASRYPMVKPPVASPSIRLVANAGKRVAA